jgi:hypothetical protein
MFKVGQKIHHKEFLPFVNNVVKTNVHNYKPGVQRSIDAKEKASYAIGAKDLIDANPVKMHSNPRGQESLMYGWGKGLPVQQPKDIRAQGVQRRSLAEVNNMDAGNYYNFKK